MNGHPEFELLDAYALGTLGEADSARVRAHLAACQECLAEAGDLRSVLDVMPHALPEVRASARVRERIFAQLDGSAPARGRRPAASSFALAGLAAALALAVGLDLWLAVALRRAQSQPAAPAVAVASPAPPRTSPPAVTRPAVPVGPPRLIARAPAAAVASAAPSAPSTADPGLRQRVAVLESSLTRERLRAQRDAARDRERIEVLQRQLADADTSVVALERLRAPRTPQPGPSAGVQSVGVSGGEAAPELVAALSSGRVYSVDGVVGSEPWHLTIVQPPAGKDAVIYTRTPDAPDGDTYRTWVLRGGATFDAGELRPAAQTELEMPMPLQTGDQVAFSREPVGTGNKPTSPFLMKVTIGP